MVPHLCGGSLELHQIYDSPVTPSPSAQFSLPQVFLLEHDFTCILYIVSKEIIVFLLECDFTHILVYIVSKHLLLNLRCRLLISKWYFQMNCNTHLYSIAKNMNKVIWVKYFKINQRPDWNFVLKSFNTINILNGNLITMLPLDTHV